MTNQRDYICDSCGKTFTPAWSEEEAHEELKQNFPGFSREQCAIVCETCYIKMGFTPSKPMELEDE